MGNNKIYTANINKKIILYAPTYRDNQHSTGIGYTYENKVDFDKLKSELSDEYIILLWEKNLYIKNLKLNHNKTIKAT